MGGVFEVSWQNRFFSSASCRAVRVWPIHGNPPCRRYHSMYPRDSRSSRRDRSCPIVALMLAKIRRSEVASRCKGVRPTVRGPWEGCRPILGNADPGTGIFGLTWAAWAKLIRCSVPSRTRMCEGVTFPCRTFWSCRASSSSMHRMASMAVVCREKLLPQNSSSWLREGPMHSMTRTWALERSLLPSHRGRGMGMGLGWDPPSEPRESSTRNHR
mmetsp:Transcript_128994/g.222878  ORF Transcript_128994/g.222878 Transcript_128994/m.222878 type:complete len:214 (-) Transcript_128994:90-731(-)